MGAAFFRFYAELNDFLPPDKRQIEFIHSFEHRVSIEDMIESLGVPHTEVDLILVGGEPVDFSYIVSDGDRISVYPVFEALDVTPLVRLRTRKLREHYNEFLICQGCNRIYWKGSQYDRMAEFVNKILPS